MTALKQLLHTIALADSSVSPFCERILQTLASILFSFDDKEFIEIVEALATALGLAVDSKIFIPLLLKLITAEASKASIKSLTNVMVFANSDQETDNSNVISNFGAISH